MDIFDFEELIAEMLSITDEQREDDSVLEDEFYNKFDIDLEVAYEFVRHLILHTPKVEAGLSGKTYNAFISRKGPFMLMKQECEQTTKKESDSE